MQDLFLFLSLPVLLSFLPQFQPILHQFDAEKELQILADSEAEKVISVLDEPMSSAEALSEVMLGPYSSGKPISRNDVISSIGGIMKNHPLYNGVYTMWEADAYDKADARYAGIDGYAGSVRRM
jgi:hypothetical protein